MMMTDFATGNMVAKEEEEVWSDTVTIDTEVINMVMGER